MGCIKVNTRTVRADALLIPMLAYCAASLLHFAHNAIYVDAYPNLPASLTSARVWMAWLAVTSVGVLGYVLMQAGRQLTGLFVTIIYAVIGFDGLAHYAVAPLSAHTPAMNLTIWLEVFAAAILLIAAARRLVQRVWQRF